MKTSLNKKKRLPEYTERMTEFFFATQKTECHATYWRDITHITDILFRDVNTPLSILSNAHTAYQQENSSITFHFVDG